MLNCYKIKALNVIIFSILVFIFKFVVRFVCVLMREIRNVVVKPIHFITFLRAERLICLTLCYSPYLQWLPNLPGDSRRIWVFIFLHFLLGLIYLWYKFYCSVLYPAMTVSGFPLSSLFRNVLSRSNISPCYNNPSENI